MGTLLTDSLCCGLSICIVILVFANISEKFIFKPQDCNLGTIINSDCYLDTALWSPSSSKLNSPSHPSESFFSTSNDSGRAMHNKYMVHRQLLSLLSNKSLICYLVNIVTLKIQRLNQWISLPVSCIWNTQNAIHCYYSWASHSICIYITVYIHEPSFKKRTKSTKMLKGNILFAFLSLSPLLWCPLAALKKGKQGSQLSAKGVSCSKCLGLHLISVCYALFY